MRRSSNNVSTSNTADLLVRPKRTELLGVYFGTQFGAPGSLAVKSRNY